MTQPESYEQHIWTELVGEIRDSTGSPFLLAVQRLKALAAQVEPGSVATPRGNSTMAKPKPPKPKGKSESAWRPGKHHGGNLHSNPKNASTGKHAKGGKGGKGGDGSSGLGLTD